MNLSFEVIKIKESPDNPGIGHAHCLVESYVASGHVIFYVTPTAPPDAPDRKWVLADQTPIAEKMVFTGEFSLMT